MPRIPTYTTTQIASERAPIPSPSRAGEIIGGAVERLALQTADQMASILEKQKAMQNKAELSKQLSQFDSDLSVATAQIRKDNISNPNEAVKLLNQKRQEIFNQYKNNIQDPDVKLAFDAYGIESVNRGNGADQLWALNENTKITQQTYFDRFQSDSAFVGQTDNLGDLLDKAAGLERDRQDIYKAWGGVMEGSNVIDKAQESLVKSYFFGQLSRGNAFKVLKEIKDKRLGPTEDGKVGLVMPGELRQLESMATKMALAGKDDAAALTLIGAVTENFNIDKALTEPISTTEEKINSISFEIKRKKDLVALGEASPDEVAVLEKHQKILEQVRAAQISRNNTQIIPNPDVEAEMNARFLGLFNKKDPKKPFKATLEDVFQFQQDLMNNREQMDPAVFNHLSALTAKSFEAEIGGYVKGSRFQTKSTWFGLGSLFNQVEAVDKNRLSHSKKLQKMFSQIISEHNPKDGNKDLFETMQFFYDDLQETLNLEDPASLEALSQDNIQELMKGAKRKMQLKKMNLPVYLNVKDVVIKNGALYRIVGYDTDGMPLVDDK